MRQSLLTVALLAVLALAWMLRNLLVLVAYAGLLAYALNPIVNWVDRRLSSRRTIPRGISTAIVMFLLVLAAGASLAAAIPPLVRQFTEFASAAPGSVRRLEQEIGAFINSHGWGGLVQAGGAQTAGTLNSLLEAAGRWLMSGAGGLIGSLAGLASLVLLPLFTFYMLADSDRGRSGLLTLVSPAGLPRAQRLLDALDRALRAYVRGQASVCLIMGAAMAIVLGLLGFPVALLLGVAVAFAEIIPVAGFWLAASAIALEGFTVRPELALVGVGSYVVVNNLIQTFASPRLLGRQVQLHPLIVNLSVIGGGMLLGPAGAILALPAAAMARVLLEEFLPRRHGSPSPSRGITTTLS